MNTDIKKEDGVFDSRNLASVEQDTEITLERSNCPKVGVHGNNCGGDCSEKVASELSHRRVEDLEGQGKGREQSIVPVRGKGWVQGGARGSVRGSPWLDEIITLTLVL